MTSSKQNFQNLRKVSSQIFVKTMWSKFQQNRPKTGKVRDDHRHTHIQTHRQGSFWDNIFSPEMTEYKNMYHCKGTKRDDPVYETAKIVHFKSQQRAFFIFSHFRTEYVVPGRSLSVRLSVCVCVCVCGRL